MKTRSGVTLLIVWTSSIAPAFAQDGAMVMQAPVAITSLDQLVGLSGAELDQIYRQGAMAGAPTGRVQGVALYPDTRLGRSRSKATKLVWQGKIFQPETSTAINKFFGLRVIKGDVYAGQSWLDGGPALILDYQQTSRLYRPYRDEIRQVGPGIYLGLMHERTEPSPTFKMYFALDANVK
jgi:hypothetical protein